MINHETRVSRVLQFPSGLLVRSRRRRRTAVANHAAEIIEARVMLSATLGVGGSGGLGGAQQGSGSHGQPKQGGGHAQPGNPQSGGQHHNGGGQSNGGSKQSGPQQGGSSNSGGSSQGGSNQGGPSQNTPSPAPAAPPQSAPASSPLAPSAPQPSQPAQPTASPATESTPAATNPEPAPTASEATAAAPETTDSTTQPENPVAPAPAAAPVSNLPVSAPGRGGVAVADASTDILAVAIRFDADARHNVEPSRADAVFTEATGETGGYIDINSADADTAASTESESGAATSESTSRQRTSDATQKALDSLADGEVQQSNGRRVRLADSAGEGGFIELATVAPDAARRHPLLDDQTRRERSSETDGSIGRSVAFDSAGTAGWGAIADSFSIADEGSPAKAGLADAPQPMATTSVVAAACGVGALLTSSHTTRRRWSSLAAFLLLQVKQVLSRLVNSQR